jgi:hypothetical protein
VAVKWTPRPPKPEPEYGAIRNRVRFAWWPVMLDDGRRCWLEYYVACERYTSFTCYESGWVSIYWKRIGATPALDP